MKVFKTVTEARDHMDSVINKLDTLIRKHRDIPSNITALDYLYFAMGETVEPDVFARKYLCDEYNLRSIMTDIGNHMDINDIITITAILQSVRVGDAARNNYAWNFEVSPEIVYNARDARIAYENLYHRITAYCIWGMIREDDYDEYGDWTDDGVVGDGEFGLFCFVKDISIPVYTPEFISESDDSAVRMVKHDIRPFVTKHSFYKNSECLYTCMESFLSVIIDYRTLSEVCSDPDTVDMKSCVHDAMTRVYDMIHIKSKRNKWGIEGYDDVFPLTLLDLHEEGLCDEYKRDHYNDDSSDYSYADFVTDIILDPNPGPWIIGVLYMLSTTTIRNSVAYYDRAETDVVQTMPGRRTVDVWRTCCDAFKADTTLPLFLAKFSIRIPITSGDKSGWVNFGAGEYEFPMGNTNLL